MDLSDLSDERIDGMDEVELNEASVEYVPGTWSNRFDEPATLDSHARHMEGGLLCDDRLRGPYIKALASLLGWSESEAWERCHERRVPPETKCRAALRAIRDARQGEVEDG